jgi:hypothetical protein
VVFLVFCSLAVAHSLTYLNQRFSYVKLPLLAMGVVFTLASLGDRSLPLARSDMRVRLGAVLAALVFGSSLVATALWLGRWP